MSTTNQSIRTAIKKTTETVVCRIYLSVDQSDLTGNGWNKINLNTASYDHGTNYDLVNYKFTVPVTGLYEIEGCVEFTSVIADKRYMAGIYKDGVLIKSKSSHASLAANLSVVIREQVFLQKDDYIELYAQPEVGAGTDTVDIKSGSTTTNLMIRLITKEGIRQ
jgi:hypothetical protein